MCVQCISRSLMTKLTRKSIKVMTFQYSKVNYKFQIEFFSAWTGMQAHGNEKQLKGDICWCVQWSIQVVGFPACFCHLPSPVLLSPLLSSLPSPVISPVAAVTASGRQTLPCHVRGLWSWSVLMESALSLFVNLKHWHVTAPPGRGTVCHSDACWYIHFEYSEFFSFVVLIAFPPHICSHWKL